MDFPWTAVSQFTSAGFMLVLAGALLYLKFSHPANRAFATYLILRAGSLITLRVSVLLGEPWDGPWKLASDALFITIAPALVLFLFQYGSFRNWRWSRMVRIAAVGVGAIALLLFAYNHDWVEVVGATSTSYGPLSVVAYAYPLAGSLVALALARDSLHGPKKAASASFVVSAALSTLVLLESGIAVLPLAFNNAEAIAGYDPSLWSWFYLVSWSVAFLGALACTVWYTSWAMRQRARWPPVAGVLLLHGVAVAAAAYVGLAYHGGQQPVPLVVVGLLRILLPAMVAYALVRHRLFGIDFKVKWTIQQGTVSLVFVGVFYVVAQITQNVAQGFFGAGGGPAGWLAGGTAAGLLLFGLRPLEKLGERVATAVLPQAKPLGKMSHSERARLFRDQAELVWADGVMHRKERAMLDNLRDRLHIPHGEAARIEHEAASASKSPQKAS